MARVLVYYYEPRISILFTFLELSNGTRYES